MSTRISRRRQGKADIILGIVVGLGLAIYCLLMWEVGSAHADTLTRGIAPGTHSWVVVDGTGHLLPPCEMEDSQNCVWWADERGNGTGSSFADIDGVAYPVQR